MFSKNPNDETLPIINKPKHPKKRGECREQNGRRPMSKKTKEPPPKRGNHQGNIKFLSTLLLQEAYQIRKGEDLLKGCLT